MKKRSILLLISFVLIIGVLITLFVIWVNHKSNNHTQTALVSGTEESVFENNVDAEPTDDYVEPIISDTTEEVKSFNYSDVKVFSGMAVQIINDNIPFFNHDEKNKLNCFEQYSELDDLGRCGEAFACISIESMPTEERGTIGAVKPSGWHTVKYDFIDGKYLYNRCHLIGYQISGENALETNLITGTRYLNIEGMLPYENMISEYITSTNNHVLYRVTPYFQGNNLIANGVLMEGWSIEDEGNGICFCVFAYNVQPGVTIDYLTGDSKEDTSFVALENDDNDDIDVPFDRTNVENTDDMSDVTYIGNKNSHRFHYPDCEGVEDMKDENKIYFYGDRNEAIEAGYVPCGSCNP